MKRWHPTHTAGDRAGPDAAGATRKNEAGPNAAGATRITAVLFGDVRAGRAAARSVVLEEDGLAGGAENAFASRLKALK